MPALIFAKYQAEGEVTNDNFEYKADYPLPSEPAADEVLMELVYVSVDPYMRGRMRDTPGYFLPPFKTGEPVSSGGICRVLKSNVQGVAPGALYSGLTPWQSQFVASTETLAGWQLVDTAILEKTKQPLSSYLGVLGMTGITAYASLTKIGKPKAGETVYISGAAGAVGSIVGQLCKHVFGCRTVGSAGSDEKVAMLTKELGFDAAYNYKTTPAGKALDELCPQGIDIYYDNVGGETLEAVLDRVNMGARVVASGMISQYDKAPAARYGVRNLVNIVFKAVTFQGFLVFQFMPDVLGEFYSTLPKWICEGKVKAPEHAVTGGLQAAGQAFVDMMHGKNIGKAVVQIC